MILRRMVRGLFRKNGFSRKYQSASLATDFAASRYQISWTRTNKCTNTNVNPPSLANMTKGGDVAAVLSIVDDATALAAAGLSAYGPNVFKLDNTAGVTTANVRVEGQAGTTGPHILSAYVRGNGSGRITGSSTGGTAYTAYTAGYVRRTTTYAAANINDRVQIEAQAGAVVYFIVNQLEEGSLASPPITVNGAARTETIITQSSVFDNATFQNVTVSRASVGYAETVDGRLVQFPANTARITDKGLLVEEARTNLLLNSQTIGFGGWSNNSASVNSDAIIAPDGTLTADKVVENTATSAHFEAQNLTLSASTTYAISVYAKAGERTRFAIGGAGGAWGSFSQATFDLATGTTVGVSGGFTSQTITPLANGWYRCVVIGTSAAAPTNAQVIQLALVNAGTATSYTGDGVSGAYFWGAQLEVGSFATSYIPTTTGSVTRAADNISVGGLNGLDQVTLFASAVLGLGTDGTNGRFAALNDGTTNNRISLTRATTNNGQANIQSGGGATVNLTSAATVTSGQTVTLATSSNGTTGRFAMNGTTAVAAAVVAPLGMNKLELGALVGSGYLNGYLRRVVLYPRAFTDAELQELTRVSVFFSLDFTK